MEDTVLERVTRIAERVASKPIPDPGANLFDSGLIDSLSAVNLMVELEETLGVSLDILEFARREAFTLAHISELVSAAPARK